MLEMFKKLETLEKWYEENIVNLEQYWEIKKNIIDKYKGGNTNENQSEWN